MRKLEPADFAELESPGVVDTIELEECGGNGKRAGGPVEMGCSALLG
jgi:hypothetical protein